MTFPDPTADNRPAYDATAPSYQPPQQYTPEQQPPTPQAYTPPVDQQQYPPQAAPGQPSYPQQQPPPRAYMPGGMPQQTGYNPYPAGTDQQGVDREYKLRKANRSIVIGLLWFIGGLLITLVTYSNSDSVYIVAWGPMLYGVLRLGVGLYGRFKNQ